MKIAGICQVAKIIAFVATLVPELNLALMPAPQDAVPEGAAAAPVNAVPATTTSPGYDYYGNTPWFAVPSIRLHLGMNDKQYDEFNSNYQKSWRAYNREYQGISNKLTPAERRRRTVELRNQFHTNLVRDNAKVFQDPASADRYNQLHLQYLGYDAFNDPNLQNKLNLTPEQTQQLNRANDRWNQQLFNWQRDYPTHRDLVSKQFAASRAAQQQQINQILTPEQRQIYEQSVGEPFDFTPEVYFPPAAATESRPE